MSFDAIPDLAMTFDGSAANAQRVMYKDRALGQFYMKAELQGYESQQAGRPIYKSVPFVRIIQPGEKDTVERPVRNEDKVRFPQAWAQFEAQGQQRIEGTPLSTLFPHNPGVVKTLDSLAITTVEQLAALNDSQLQNIGLGAREWQQMAQNFMSSAEKGKGFQAMQSQLDTLTAQVAKLVSINEALQSENDALKSEKSPRGKRAQNGD